MNDNFEIMNLLNEIIHEINIRDFEEKIVNSPPNDFFIFESENKLCPHLCDELIELFEKSDNKYSGVTGSGLNKKIKDTTDLLLNNIENKKYDTELFNFLNNELKIYSKRLYDKFHNNFFSFNNIVDHGYQMQKYNKNEGFYKWHHDFSVYKNFDSRVLTFIWYLNDVDEGGETFFLNGKIKPKKGKFVLFPSTWTYLHKGNMPISNDKYIITGWCFCKQFINI